LSLSSEGSSISLGSTKKLPCHLSPGKSRSTPTEGRSRTEGDYVERGGENTISEPEKLENADILPATSPQAGAEAGGVGRGGGWEGKHGREGNFT